MLFSSSDPMAGHFWCPNPKAMAAWQHWMLLSLAQWVNLQGTMSGWQKQAPWVVNGGFVTLRKVENLAYSSTRARDPLNPSILTLLSRSTKKMS